VGSGGVMGGVDGMGERSSDRRPPVPKRKRLQKGNGSKQLELVTKKPKKRPEKSKEHARQEKRAAQKVGICVYV